MRSFSKTIGLCALLAASQISFAQQSIKPSVDSLPSRDPAIAATPAGVDKNELKYNLNTSGIQYQLGPMSKVKPSARNTRARPPGPSFFSRMVTRQPAWASVLAAARPAKPAPITTACFGEPTGGWVLA